MFDVPPAAMGASVCVDGEPGQPEGKGDPEDRQHRGVEQRVADARAVYRGVRARRLPVELADVDSELG